MENATIAVVDTAGGVDLTLTAPAERVQELRRRTRDVAALYGPAAHRGLGHGGKHLGAQRHGLRLSELPALRADVDDVEGGARLHLVAKISEQADELRARVHERVDEVRAGPCD